MAALTRFMPAILAFPPADPTAGKTRIEAVENAQNLSTVSIRTLISKDALISTWTRKVAVYDLPQEIQD